MGELWRSKEMKLIQIFLQFEAAHETLEAIGNLGLLQFIDLNPDVPPHQRQFVTDLKRLNGLEDIIAHITKEIDVTNRQLKALKRKDEQIRIIPAKQVAPEMNKHTDELEVILKEIIEQLKDLSEKKEKLDISMLQVIEQQHILGAKDEGFFLEEDRIHSEEGEVTLEDISKEEIVQEDMMIVYNSSVVLYQ
jgi:V-type H+-transporting ATPase subunit a